MPTTETPDQSSFLPHIDVLLQSLRISRDRLSSRSKVAIDTRLLRALLQSLVRQMPFDPGFYIAENPDVAAAFKAGAITDLHRHFYESGYFEGRFGAPPPVDEKFYTSTYQDIGTAVRQGAIASGAEHYMRSGAAEGRLPCEAMRPHVEQWAALLSDVA